MAEVIELPGGEGVPPEPNWLRFFGRKADREAASEHWRRIVNELRGAEKLAVVNTHAIQRLVVAYVQYDQAAKAVLKIGAVIPAPKTKVLTYNPWWSVQSSAAGQIEALEKQLCLTPRERNNGGRVDKKTRRATGADAYLKPRSA